MAQPLLNQSAALAEASWWNAVSEWIVNIAKVKGTSWCKQSISWSPTLLTHTCSRWTTSLPWFVTFRKAMHTCELVHLSQFIRLSIMMWSTVLVLWFLLPGHQSEWLDFALVFMMLSNSFALIISRCCHCNSDFVRRFIFCGCNPFYKDFI